MFSKLTTTQGAKKESMTDKVVDTAHPQTYFQPFNPSADFKEQCYEGEHHN